MVEIYDSTSTQLQRPTNTRARQSSIYYPWVLVVEKTEFHRLRRKKRDLEERIRCLIRQCLWEYVWYGFTGWRTSQDQQKISQPPGDGLGSACSWRSYASVCTGLSPSLFVSTLFPITPSNKLSLSQGESVHQLASACNLINSCSFIILLFFFPVCVVYIRTRHA